MIIKVKAKVITKNATKKGVYWMYKVSDGKEIYDVLTKNQGYEIDKTYEFTLSYKMPTCFEGE